MNKHTSPIINRRRFIAGSCISLCPIATNAAPHKICDIIAVLTDHMRMEKGHNSLRVSNRLNHAAEAFSRVLAKNQHLSHTADGRKLSDRALSAGYNFQRLGENIGWTSRVYTPEDIASDLVARWMNSRGHRVNILNRRFQDIGVGVTQSGNRTYAVQMFGTKV